jgi:hypothetical protein
MSNQAYNNTLAHGIGHAFGLTHAVGTGASGPAAPANPDGNNLMCNPFDPLTQMYCPDQSHLGSYLSPKQIADAMSGIMQWVKPPN